MFGIVHAGRFRATVRSEKADGGVVEGGRARHPFSVFPLFVVRRCPAAALSDSGQRTTENRQRVDFVQRRG
jgi:hypothetical protein